VGGFAALVEQPLLAGAASAAILFGLSGGRARRRVGVAASLLLALLGLARVAALVADRLRVAREWDFLLFWLAGRAVHLGRDPYQPASYVGIELPLAPSEAFRDEFLAVGLLHLPPTLLLFAPLGLLDYFPAYACWYAVQLLALGGSAWLLWRLFLADRGREGALAALALLVAFRPTLATIGYGQTNLLLLLCLLLALREAGRARSGLWIVLAALVKPLAAALGLLPLLRGEPRVLAVAVVSGVAALLAALALIGPEAFLGYWTDPPVARAPARLHTQSVDQHLLAEMLRRAPQGSAVRPLFFALAGLLVATTAWLARRTARSEPAAAFSLVLACALLVYPSTLYHYSVVLLLPLLWLWSRRAIVPGGELAVAGLGGALFALLTMHHKHAFEANAVVWLAVAALHVRLTWDAAGADRVARVSP
jgi:hypothetical protein